MKLYLAHGVSTGWLGMYRMASLLGMGLLNKVTGESSYRRKETVLTYYKETGTLALLGDESDKAELSEMFGLDFVKGSTRQEELLKSLFY